eukprot:jgi/Tetstr1/455154/TSEL_042004.t1
MLPPGRLLTRLSCVELERLAGRVYNALAASEQDPGQQGGLSRDTVQAVLCQVLGNSVLNTTLNQLIEAMARSSKPDARVAADVFLDHFPAILEFVQLQQARRAGPAAAATRAPIDPRSIWAAAEALWSLPAQSAAFISAGMEFLTLV